MGLDSFTNRRRRAIRILCCVSLLLMGLLLIHNIRAQSPERAIEYYNSGRKRHAEGNLEGAITDFTRAIELSSRLIDNRDELANSFNKIRAVDPLTALAYTNRGLVLYRLKNLEGAITDCRRAIAINPRIPEAHNCIGLALSKKGDPDGAVRSFDRALVVDPNFAEAYNNRGKLFSTNREYKKAIADFTRALALNPKEARIYYNRADSRYKMKDLAGAMIDLNRAIELDSRLAAGYHTRGLIHFMLGRDKEAERDLEQTIKLDPSAKEKVERSIMEARELRGSRKNRVK
jgi:tetratricopeptide (TPR) repeat protein